MKPTKPGRRAIGMIAAMLAVAPLAGCKVEQIMIGQFYSIPTPPVGGCPALLWQFVVNPQRSIDGSLFSNNQRKIATLSGVLNPDDSFQMTAKQSSGGPQSTVTGQFTSAVSTITIHGAVAGTECDGKTFTLYLGSYFSRQGGGGGGGG